VQKKQISIFKLAARDSQELSRMLFSGTPQYRKFFQPFSFSPEDLNARLSASRRDQYWGMRYEENLVGFFMLRGWDEGFERPSFGVYVAETLSNRGLAKLALQHALNWCRQKGVSAVMLKVHPENTGARRVYEEAGFDFIEICPETGHQILEKRLD
jgi:RimJ/RimL family protein N-acetyltransferase